VFTGAGGAAVVVNPGGTALTVTTGTLALAGAFATTGAFSTTFAQQASVTLTLPAASDTLATLSQPETLSNKTLVAPALGTPTSGVMTNVTGTAAGLTVGSATTATTATNVSGGTASVTTLAASGAVSGAGFAALLASPSAIGSTAPSTGAFTTLAASSTVSGAGFTALFASPPAIGGTAASSGKFTTVSASGQITSTVTTGTAPLVIASTTNVANLNASSLSGATFASPGAIGSGSASTGAFTTLNNTTASGSALNGTLGATAAASALVTTLGASGLITPTSTAGIAGTSTNDNPSAGSIGEFAEVILPGTAATVTMTIAAPCVVTYTSHGMAVNGNCAGCLAVYFTTTGALPTGLAINTTYYATIIDANTFHLSTTIANAFAGTYITTTGSQSGTQTCALQAYTSANGTNDAAALDLTAGDWDVSGSVSTSDGGTNTSMTVWTSTVSKTTPGAPYFGRLNQWVGSVSAVVPTLTVGTSRYLLSGTTPVYLSGTCGSSAAFGLSGYMRARRAR